jgi:hypothetical protein
MDAQSRVGRAPVNRDELEEFDVVRLWEAMNAQRKDRGLALQGVVDEIRASSAVLVARLGSVVAAAW